MHNIVAIEPNRLANAAEHPPGQGAVVEDAAERGEEDEGIVLDDVEPGGLKRARTTRKFTLWNFVDGFGNSTSYCKLGCLDEAGVSRMIYSTPNSGPINRHLFRWHKDILQMYNDTKINKQNINQLIEKIEQLDSAAVVKATKRRRQSDSFWAKAIKLEPSVISEIKLLMWAITNGISRNSLNDPLFDSFLKSVGAQMAPNRHTIHDQHLPVLDHLVLDSQRSELKNILSVALSSDGWRDRSRRDWVNIVVTFIRDSKTAKKWEIRVLEPDLIFLPSSATGDTIAFLINDVLDSVVRIIFHFSLFVSLFLYSLMIASRKLFEKLLDH